MTLPLPNDRERVVFDVQTVGVSPTNPAKASRYIGFCGDSDPGTQGGARQETGTQETDMGRYVRWCH